MPWTLRDLLRPPSTATKHCGLRWSGRLAFLMGREADTLLGPVMTSSGINLALNYWRTAKPSQLRSGNERTTQRARAQADHPIRDWHFDAEYQTSWGRDLFCC